MKLTLMAMVFAVQPQLLPAMVLPGTAGAVEENMLVELCSRGT